MGLFKVLVLACALLTAELRENRFAENHCCLPDQWEADVSQVAGQVVEGKAYPSITTGSLHVDVTNNRVVSDTLVDTDGTITHVTVYRTKSAMWIAYPDLKSCSKVDAPLVISNCIPGTALSGGSRLYGDSGDSMVADVWKIHDVHPGISDIRAEVTVSKEKCFPVIQTNIGHVNQLQFTSTVQFSNMTGGIKDPGIFDRPDYCKTANGIYADNRIMLGIMTIFLQPSY